MPNDWFTSSGSAPAIDREPRRRRQIGRSASPAARLRAGTDRRRVRRRVRIGEQQIGREEALRAFREIPRQRRAGRRLLGVRAVARSRPTASSARRRAASRGGGDDGRDRRGLQARDRRRRASSCATSAGSVALQRPCRRPRLQERERHRRRRSSFGFAIRMSRSKNAPVAPSASSEVNAAGAVTVSVAVLS